MMEVELRANVSREDVVLRVQDRIWAAVPD